MHMSRLDPGKIARLLCGNVVRVEYRGNECIEEVDLLFDDNTAISLFVSREVGRLEISRRRFGLGEIGRSRPSSRSES